MQRSLPKPIKALASFLAPALLACGLAAESEAQTTLTTQPVANGFVKPLEAISPPGDDRIFVVEQNSGLIRIIQGGVVLPTPFLNVKSKIKSSGNEEGLLGLAFHPDFANNGQIFINYTAGSPNRTVVARYQVSGADPNQINPATFQQIISYSQPFSNHNGGCLRFGLDGYLYIGTGDGGSASDPGCRAQNPGEMLGKMLRIDVDNGLPYTVPASNPWVGTPGYLPELWAVGLRNPWRYAFDAMTGELYIGDVGQGQREEVDVVPMSDGGFNFGWKIMEGINCFSTSGCGGPLPPCNDPALTNPVTDYSHGGGFGGPCSITGGEVYRGCKIPELFGTYFYADYCDNKIYSFEYVGGVVTNHVQRTAELAPGGGLSINSITSFGVDGDGELLIVDQGGEIFRVVASSQPPIADCDSNGKDDLCEIAMDPSLDANGNGVLDVCEPACGFTQYGVGASPANYMVLSGAGSTSVGGVTQFVTTGVVGTNVLSFLSLGQASFPIVGGVGLIDQALTLMTASNPAAAGTSTWSVPIPAGPGIAGISVYAQSAAIDGGQPGGWGLSNGLQLTVCP